MARDIADPPPTIPPEPVPVVEPPLDPRDSAEAPAAPEPPSPPVAAAEPPPGPPPVEVAPSSGTITYELFYGGGSIGRSVQTWRIEGSTYRLTSLSEPVGLVALFLPYQFAYTSEGKIVPEGLRPENFTARSGRGGARRAVADFNWEKHEITLGAVGATRSQPLPDGTQDLLSFVYQIGLTPAIPGRRQMVITSGTKVDNYVLDIGMEQAIDLPAGPMRAIPVRRIAAPGEESMELWLAATPPRLPVRIRFFDRAGKMTIEQLASKIDLNGS